MSQITRFIGTDPNGTQSSMAKVIVSSAGFLSIANLPYDEKYTFRFWIKTSAIVNGIALQKDDTIIENIASTTSWQKITAKFEGTTGQDVKFYLPQGTYYFWHSKLEIGTMESDYSQSQKDFELQVVETRLELNSRINQTTESITHEVTRAKNAEENLSSKVEQTAESITSTVAKSVKNYDETNININIYGFGEPQSSYPANVDYNNKYYLDQTTGMVYRCVYSQEDEDYVWMTYIQLPTIQDSATSEIEQTATSITSTVAQTQNTWLEEHPVGTPITIKYKGYGTPLASVNPSNNPYPKYSVNDLYLNVNNGSVYRLASASATSSNISFTWTYIYSLTAINAELESKIEQTAESITSTIARASYTFDEGAFNGTIDFYGYGDPELIYPASATYSGKKYLDQMNGKVYSCFEFVYPSYTTYGWNVVQTLPYEADSLSSRIEQTLSSISFTLTKQDEDTAVLSMNYTKEDGSVITLSAQSIQFTGLVEFTDLSGNGTTSINGANIQTGTLSADKITTGTMSCDRLNGGTISGQTIQGGTITGSIISAKDSFKLTDADGYGFTEFVTEWSGSPRGGNPALRIKSWDIYLEPENYIYLKYGNNTYTPIYNYGGGTHTIIGMQMISETPYMEVKCAGSVFGISAWTSDINLKKNIKTTDVEALRAINKIEFVQFDWKETSSHVELGLIANQIENFMPDVVIDIKQPENNKYESIKNIDTGKMTTYALKGIQELSASVKQQHKEIESLKSEIAELKDMIKSLMEK